jgi:PAS domain S-box-containing protein
MMENPAIEARRASASEEVEPQPGARGQAERQSALSAILEHSPVGILLVDSALRLVQVNPRARPMLAGIEPLVGRDLGEALALVWAAPIAADVAGRFRHTLETGRPNVHRGLVVVRRDSDVREHVQCELHRLPLGGGGTGVVGFFMDITDHVRAQEALAKGEQRVRATFEQAALGMAVADLDGRFVHVNQRLAKTLGYAPEELRGRTFVDLTHPDDRALTLDHARRLVDGEISDYALEKRYLRKDGSSVWVLATVGMLRDDAGRPEHFVGVVEDISARRRFEERERETRERMQLALSAGRLGDWAWDATTDFVRLGPRAADIFGREAGRPVPWTELHEWLHAEDRARVLDARDRAMRERSDYDLEYRLLHPDVGETWVAARGRVFSADGTSVTGMIGVVQDVTDRKRLELARERLAAVIDCSDDAIVSKDLDGIVRTWNGGAARLFGYSEQEMVGAKITRLIPPELEYEEEDILARLRRGERLDPFETVRVAKDGRRLNVFVTISPIRDATGRIVGASKVARDITARKRAEAELLRAAEERQALLEAERSARAEAERVSFQKDEFLATLSHELRTPLNAIVGWSQLLRTRGHADADVLEGLSVIERNAKIQAKLIEDLLDTSRIVSGKIRLEVQDVAVADVVRAAIAAVRHSAESKGVLIEIALDPFSGSVRGDPGRLQQCFWNLLSNAIKFTPKGGRARVSLSRAGDRIEFRVDDDGQGIPPEFLPHVFERFRQADASTTRRHGGLGLGLSIVKNLVEMHGGSVRASSAGVGRGATFVLELPASDGPNRAEKELDGERVQVPSLAGVTVLLVDDEPDARLLVKRVLEERGAQVFVAESAREGLDLLRREKPDLVLSDIGMPIEDGYAFIRQVRSLAPGEGGRIPAAALSAFARPEDRARALRAGYQVHIAKPTDPVELTAVVARLAALD